MVDWTNFTNRFNNEIDSLNSIKEHFSNFLFIGGEGKGIVDLKLDIVGEETLSADSDVTDHYVESNIAYQDQISLKPKVYTINGEVGELVWYQKDMTSQPLGQVAQRLEGIISFLPIRSRSFNQMKTKIMKAAQWIDTASNAASKLANLNTIGNNQQQAFIRLTEFRDARLPINIQSPWGLLKNYVITNLRFSQPKDTKDKSIISITLKEFRTTRVSTVEYDASKYQGNSAFERQPITDNGTTSGENAGLPQKQEEYIEDGYIEKKYTTPIEYNGQWYKLEYYPDDASTFVSLPNGKQIDDLELYNAVIDTADRKIENNIKQGVWRD